VYECMHTDALVAYAECTLQLCTLVRARVRVCTYMLIVLTVKCSGAGSGMAAAIPISNLLWQRHTNPMKFGQLILRKIIKIVATRCRILSLKCTKINFGWGSAPDPAGGELTALPQTPWLD